MAKNREFKEKKEKKSKSRLEAAAELTPDVKNCPRETCKDGNCR